MTKDEMRADIARVLRMPPDEVNDEDDLADLGLDSMRAMSLLMDWEKKGLPLDFAAVAERLTLNGWWAVASRGASDGSSGG